MDFITHGYEELELSTQILIKEALNRNIDVEVLDWKENFIRLKKEGRIEYIKQATRTSADNYIAPLLMENKHITKLILREQGILVPQGIMTGNSDEALKSFDRFKNTGIVIKPNSTNFGIGITIIENNNSTQRYEDAVNIAFKHDRTIIIEEYIQGKEYRFLIINNEVIAVLQRVSANVIGDGSRTMSELIQQKNSSPLRGRHYKTPLEKIEQGPEEELFLKDQGKDFNYIPGNNEQVFLRKNSNISTGGDSIDYTDDVLFEYKKIAVRAAQAVGAKICGADIIIRDITALPSADNYGIIELNFNPAIHIHGFPYQGNNRYAEKKILDLLGFMEKKHVKNQTGI